MIHRYLPKGPALWELALLIAVMLGLVWQYQGLREQTADTAEDNRYAMDVALQPAKLKGYGRANLDTFCHRVDLPPRLKWRWESACRATKSEDAGDPASLGAALDADYQALQQAVILGEAQRKSKLAPMAKSVAEGVLPDEDRAVLNEAISELNRYRSRYQLNEGIAPSMAGSLPLSCAWAQSLAWHANATEESEQTIALANQLALIRGSSGRFWWPKVGVKGSTAPASWAPKIPEVCVALGRPQQVMVQAANLAQQIRQGETLATKAKAMLRLQAHAPWLLLGWGALTWVLLSLVRITVRPARYLPVALMSWSIAGSVSGLHFQTTGEAVPWWFWLVMASTGLLLWLLARFWPRIESTYLLAPCPAQQNVSFLSYPLFVLFVGLGWWLVFDLAMNGHVRNRYIALNQSIPIFGAFMLLSIVPVFTNGLAKMWITWAGLITNALRPRHGGAMGGWLRPLAIWLFYALAFWGLALGLKNWRQFTGEAFRWWLLLGVSWFFMLRASRWANVSPSGWSWLWNSLLPLLVHVVVVLGALILTDDLGPILVVLFVGAVYVGAFLGQAMLARGMAWPAATGTGLLVAICTAALLLGGLYTFSKLPIGPAQRVADRVESVLNPFSAENDQLAHVLWFRKHTPAEGYGLGNVPWCGTLPAANCPGVPAQTQSDYTFSALQGAVGFSTALGLLAIYLLWFGLLAVRQAAQTQGQLNPGVNGATQVAWLAWLAVCWAGLVVVQCVVTVLGNVGALPLTGVTWPLFSYGSWSLLGCALFLGLVMHRMEVSE